MVQYSKVNDKLSDTQLKKLKTAVRTKTGATPRSLKMLNGNDLSYELLLTTRQKTLKNKLRNALVTICQLI